MSRFTLRQLEYFRATAERGSFAAAAQELHVSATAVAAAITELELALGAQLLIRRKSQGVGLTPTGSYVLGEARAILAGVDELEYSIVRNDGELRGPVTIGCYSTLAPTTLPELAAGLEPRHPGVQLSYVDGGADDLLALLFGNRIDLLITYRLGLPDGLQEVELYKTNVHALLPAAHRLAMRDTVSLHELADDPLVMLDLAPGNAHTLNMLHDAGIAPRVRHRTPNFELVRSMVARGLGYSLLVQKPQIDTSYEGLPLVAVPVAPDPSQITALVVWPREVRLSARASAVVDYLRTFAARVHDPAGAQR